MDSGELRFTNLGNFDRGMMDLDERFNVLNSLHQYITLAHEGDKVIAFERGPLLFVFNFHPTNVIFLSETLIEL